MNLLDAYRFHRARPVPTHVLGGRVQPTFNGQSYAMPDDGIGAAAYALKLARADMLAHRNAKAHYETIAALRDAGHVGEPAWRAALAAVTATRRYLPSPAALMWADDKPGFAYVDKPESYGLRHVGNVEANHGRDPWSGRDSCGWYTDPYGDASRDGTGLCWGVVYQLPARDGRARFVAGYQHGGTDSGPALDLGTVYTGERGDNCDYEGAQGNSAAHDAARAADSMAEREAEREREYQTAWSLGTIYADARREVTEARTAALALLAERRTVARGAIPAAPAICQAIRESVAGHVATIRTARATMAAALSGDGPHDLCVYMGPVERVAFCEGAGLETFPHA